VSSPFQIADDLSYHKKDILENEKDYVPFIINRYFSNVSDSIYYANEMNMLSGLDVRLQHDYYLHGLRKSKRWAKWNKKDKDEAEIIEMIQSFYGFSPQKAREALRILNEEQLSYIYTRMNPV